MKIKLSVTLMLLGMLLSACATSTLQAPCDQYAHFCASKTKINSW